VTPKYSADLVNVHSMNKDLRQVVHRKACGVTFGPANGVKLKSSREEHLEFFSTHHGVVQETVHIRPVCGVELNLNRTLKKVLEMNQTYEFAMYTKKHRPIITNGQVFNEKINSNTTHGLKSITNTRHF